MQKNVTVLFVGYKGYEPNWGVFAQALLRKTSLVKIEAVIFDPTIGYLVSMIDRNPAVGVIFDPEIPVDILEEYLRNRYTEKKITLTYGRPSVMNGKRQKLQDLGRDTFEMYATDSEVVLRLTSNELIDALTH